IEPKRESYLKSDGTQRQPRNNTIPFFTHSKAQRCSAFTFHSASIRLLDCLIASQTLLIRIGSSHNQIIEPQPGDIYGLEVQPPQTNNDEQRGDDHCWSNHFVV